MTDVNILKTGSDLLTFLSKRWWIILGCLIVGLAIGYARGLKTPPVYETQLIGETNNISNAAVVGVLNNLKSAANANNYVVLTSQTGIKQGVTQTIFALDAEIFENKNPIENLNNNVFYVTVSTSDLHKIPAVIKGLERFINNDKLFRGRGTVSISTQYDRPSKPQNPLVVTLLKYGIVFFVLGIGLAVSISLIVNIKAYQKATGNA